MFVGVFAQRGTASLAYVLTPESSAAFHRVFVGNTSSPTTPTAPRGKSPDVSGPGGTERDMKPPHRRHPSNIPSFYSTVKEVYRPGAHSSRCTRAVWDATTVCDATQQFVSCLLHVYERSRTLWYQNWAQRGSSPCNTGRGGFCTNTADTR